MSNSLLTYTFLKIWHGKYISKGEKTYMQKKLKRNARKIIFLVIPLLIKSVCTKNQ